METITSKSNALCVHLRKLAASRSHREETGEFLCDSPKLLQEAVQWGADIRAVLFTSGVELPAGLENTAARVAEVSEAVMRSVSPMETPQGVVFSCALPGNAPPERLDGPRCGAGFAIIAVVASIALTIIIVLFAMIPESKKSLVLVINAVSYQDEDQIMQIINENCYYAKTRARNISKTNMNLAIEVKVQNQKDLINKLMDIENITTASLVEHDGNITV